MDLSTYARAQPTQTPSMGTPYGQPSAKGTQPGTAFAGGTANFNERTGSYAGLAPGVYTPTGKFYGGDPAQGLMQAQRERDAFVMQMNQAMLPYQMANVFGQDLGAPNYDFNAMIGRANNMIENGFYNPFTQYFSQDPMQQIGQYAPPSMYAPPVAQQFGTTLIGVPPTAPPMQADPYQQWLSTLPGYQPRDQWMTKQPPAPPPPQQPAATAAPAASAGQAQPIQPQPPRGFTAAAAPASIYDRAQELMMRTGLGQSEAIIAVQRADHPQNVPPRPTEAPQQWWAPRVAAQTDPQIDAEAAKAEAAASAEMVERKRNTPTTWHKETARKAQIRDAVAAYKKSVGQDAGSLGGARPEQYEPFMRPSQEYLTSVMRSPYQYY
jgi:hypothetical protein